MPTLCEHGTNVSNGTRYNLDYGYDLVVADGALLGSTDGVAAWTRGSQDSIVVQGTVSGDAAGILIV